MNVDLKRASSVLAKLQPTPLAERHLNLEQRKWLAAWRKGRNSRGAWNIEQGAADYAASLSDNWTEHNPVRSDIAAELDPLFERCRVRDDDSAENAALKYQEYRLA